MKRRKNQGRPLDPLALLEARAGELHALGARRIGVFGSMARGEGTPESDVDIYLEFVEGMRTYDNFYSLHEILEMLFGRPVDLVTDGSLSERKSRLILPTVRYAALDAGVAAAG
jgi:predicted nucleotidyltransferase